MNSSFSWRGQGRGGRGEGRGGRGPRGRFHSHHQYGPPRQQYSHHTSQGAANPSHYRAGGENRGSHDNARRSQAQYTNSQRTRDTSVKNGANNANIDYMSIPIPSKRNRNRDVVMDSVPDAVSGSANDATVLPKAAPASRPPPSEAENKVPSKDSNAVVEDVVMADATESNGVKRPKLDRDIIVTKENWGQTSSAQKLLSESPFETVDLDLADQLRIPTEWMGKKILAAENTIVEMRALIAKDNDKYYDPYDSERSEESVLVGNNYGSCDRTPPGFYQFVKTLPYSILIDAGFLVYGIHADDEKYCFCPCSLRMKKWRRNMDLCEPTGLDSCGASFKNGSPNALMDHIRKIASHDNAYLHKALKLYLEKLYDNFWNSVTPGVHHKGLYVAGTNDFKRAEAAEKKYLKRAIDSYTVELQRKEDLIKEQKKKLDELKAVQEANPFMTEKLMRLEKNFQVLGVKEQVKFLTLDEIDEKSLHSFKKQMAYSIEMHRKGIIDAAKVKNPIVITTPPKINIQDLFDKWYEEDSKDTTYIFRSLDNLNAKSKSGQFAYKVLCDWEVNVEVPREVLRKGSRDRKDMTAVDKGGPTRAFVTAFCEQLRDLCVYVPLRHEGNLKRPPPFARVQKWLTDEIGIVVIKGKATRGDNNKETEEQKNFRIKFEDGHEELLERAAFEVIEYPFPLFDDSCVSCAVPHRDTSFDSMYKNIEEALDSEWNLELLLQKVCRYYEAIGRVIVHVLFDEKVILSSIVMPQLLKNYLFYGISPDDGEFRYPLTQLLVDIQNMEPTFTLENMTGTELEIETWADDEFIKKHNFHHTVKASDLVTADNFRTLAVLHLIKSRDMALQQIQKGLTLGGILQLPHIFFGIPSIVLNALCFSNPSYDIEDILKILIFVPYKGDNDDGNGSSIFEESHELFQKDSLPSALRSLQEKDKDTLNKFIYFVTGCSYLPNLEMNPDFRIDVEFEKKDNPEFLPTSHTCEKIIVFPVEVYDNNVETLVSKLEKAFSFGDCFGMQ